MIHLDTQTAHRIPRAPQDPRVSAEIGRRIENMRASSAFVRTEPQGTAIAVRMLGEGDLEALAKLAELDSSEVPSGRLLAAEADGALSAVLSLENGTIIADPFRATASAVELLRLRARQITGSEPGRRRRFHIPRLPRARGAIAGSPPGGGSHLLQL